MDSFILFGTNGWQHVEANRLTRVDDGVLGIGQSEMFITTAVQSDFFARGVSVGRPGWENRLNDYVTEFVEKGQVSTSIAQDLFIRLGQEEGRAAASMNHNLLAQQRVREAALAFNLLATRSNWKPAIPAGFPYRSRDWVTWCDQYIETLRGAARDIGPIDFMAARSYERAVSDMATIRAAFASGAVKQGAPSASVGHAAGSKGGCYVATAVYGSYDTPEVWVLRRWRDQVLQRTRSGRAVVRVYYSVSPALVRRVGMSRWFTRLTLLPLDWLVARLMRRGFSNLPYSDGASGRTSQNSVSLFRQIDRTHS